MTPKEKANELFDGFYNYKDAFGFFCMTVWDSKQLALKTINEARNEAGDLCNDYRCKERVEFWNEVENELNQL